MSALSRFREIVEFIADIIRPGDPIPITDWCELYYHVDKTSPIPGKWRRHTSPWLVQPMLDFQNARVSQITYKAAAQVVGKTEFAKMCLTWAVCEEPGPAMWVLPAQDECRTFSRTRLRDTWEKTEPIAKLMPDDRSNNATLEVNFATMPFIMVGADSGSKLTGKPLRYVFADEPKDYNPGTLEVLKKRVSRWIGLSKFVVFSTPYWEEDDVEGSFKEGNQQHWHVYCPHCRHSQELQWIENIQFDTTLKFPDGPYNYPEIFKTIKIVCVKCKGTMATDSVTEREELNDSAYWVAYNPGAADDKKSYTASAMINPQFPLSILVEEYLKAKESERLGSLKPLQDFYNQRLGLGWSLNKDDGNKRTNVEDYKVEDLKNGYKFMTCDVQTLGIFYGAVWHWEMGRARFVDARKMISWNEVEKMQEDNKIEARFVFIDFGYDNQAVWSQCVANGWRALRGLDREQGFIWKYERNGKPEWVKRVISKEFLGDPAQGKRGQGRSGKCRFHYYDNTGVKDILARIIRERLYTEPENVPAEYTEQMRSERKVKRKGKWIWERVGKRDNHYWDCACQQVTVAILAGLLKVDLIAQSTAEKRAKSQAKPGDAVPVEQDEER